MRIEFAFALPLLCAGCVGGTDYDGGLTARAGFTELFDPLWDGGQTQNGQTQNGQTQNGQTQNGQPLALTGVDLRTMKRLLVKPGPGQNPDLSASNLVAVPNVHLVGSLLTDGDTTHGLSFFVGTVVSASFTDGSPGFVYIEAAQVSSTDSDVIHYTLKSVRQTVVVIENASRAVANASCGSRFCGGLESWSYACNVNALTGLPLLATAVGGQWDYQVGVAGGGRKLIEQSSADYDKRITFACSSGAIGKCVERLDYKPWKLARKECHRVGLLQACVQPTLELAHEACVRMIRADYCGDGQNHTLDGISIDVWDQSNVQVEAPYSTDSSQGLPYGLEGEWTPNGARCVNNMLMTRTSHANSGDVSVGGYVEAHCADKWRSNAPGFDPNFNWYGGDCFKRGPSSQKSTYYTENLPWTLGGQISMDLHNRVFIQNSSVCIDDAFFGRPNPMKTSTEWKCKCLPEANPSTPGGGTGVDPACTPLASP